MEGLENKVTISLPVFEMFTLLALNDYYKELIFSGHPDLIKVFQNFEKQVKENTTNEAMDEAMMILEIKKMLKNKN